MSAKSILFAFPKLTGKEKWVLVAWDHNSVPSDILFKLPTYIGFAENQLS